MIGDYCRNEKEGHQFSCPYSLQDKFIKAKSEPTWTGLGVTFSCLLVWP